MYKRQHTNTHDDTRTSKFLSRVLRHSPEEFGLTLEPGGWVAVDLLIKNTRIDRTTLERIVANSDKQRYSFNEAGDKIRANQGHSVEVDLQLEPATPPEFLFHGTADRNVSAILAGGLQRRSRHHVHLSLDIDTATAVGVRHGRPIVLRISAGAMHRAGHEFYCSANQVWLVNSVPQEFIGKG